MNFRAMGLKVAVATAVVAGTAIASAPAQAYGLNKPYDLYTRTLNFNGSAFFNSGSGFFDFGPSTALGGGPKNVETFGDAGTALTLQDLNLTSTGANTWSLTTGSVNNFITGLANGISFRLDSFDLVKTKTQGSLEFYDAKVSGLFFSPKYADGVATKAGDIFQIQINNKSVKAGSYVGEISTIPTPALLPGLIGMGVAALRKRKSETSEEAEA